MKKVKAAIVISLLSVSVFAGCSKPKDDTSSSSKSSSTQSTIKSSSTSSTKEAKKSDSWSEVVEEVKKSTEAKNISTLYSSDTPIEETVDDVSFSMNGYCYVQIDDFSRDFKITFGDQNQKGGVLLISTTIENNSNESVFVGPGFSMSVIGYDSSIGSLSSVLEDDVFRQLSKNKSELKAGESISGYVALTVKLEAMEKIDEHHVGQLEIPGVYKKADSYMPDDAIIKEKEVILSLSKDGDWQVESSKDFYADKLTVNNMGTKTLITSKEVGEEKDFEGIKVTFDGYQIVDFQPNEDEASRFSKFDTGVVIMTAKVTIQNNDKQTLNLDGTSGTLTLGNTVKTMHENMLETISDSPDLEPNKTGTKYLVFTMDKESYDKLYKDQTYKLDVTLQDNEYKSITSIEDIMFEFKN